MGVPMVLVGTERLKQTGLLCLTVGVITMTVNVPSCRNKPEAINIETAGKRSTLTIM